MAWPDSDWSVTRLSALAFPLLVRRIFVRELIPSTGSPTSWSISIPAEPALMGTEFFLRLATRDTASGQIAFSNPGEGVVGAR